MNWNVGPGHLWVEALERMENAGKTWCIATPFLLQSMAEWHLATFFQIHRTLHLWVFRKLGIQDYQKFTTSIPISFSLIIQSLLQHLYETMGYHTIPWPANPALSTHGRTLHGTVGLVVAACPTQCWRWNPGIRADLLSKSSWFRRDMIISENFPMYEFS